MLTSIPFTLKLRIFCDHKFAKLWLLESSMPLTQQDRDNYKIIRDRGGYSKEAEFGFKVTQRNTEDFFLCLHAYKLASQYFNNQPLDLENTVHVQMLDFCKTKFLALPGTWSSLNIEDQKQIIRIIDADAIHAMNQKAAGNTAKNIINRISAGVGAVAAIIPDSSSPRVALTKGAAAIGAAGLRLIGAFLPGAVSPGEIPLPALEHVFSLEVLNDVDFVKTLESQSLKDELTHFRLNYQPELSKPGVNTPEIPLMAQPVASSSAPCESIGLPEQISPSDMSGLPTIKECDGLIELAEKNQQAAEITKGKLDPSAECPPESLPTQFIEAGVAISRVLYQSYQYYEQVEGEHAAYKAAEKKVEEQLKEIHRKFDLRLSLGQLKTYKDHSLPALELKMAQVINFEAYQSLVDSEKFFTTLKANTEELKTYIKRSEENKVSASERIAYFQKQQQIYSKIRSDYDKILAYAQRVLNTASSAGGVIGALASIGSVFTGRIADKNKKRIERQFTQSQERISHLSELCEVHQTLMQQHQRDIDAYQAAIDANNHFVRQNAHLFFGTTHRHALTVQINENGTLKNSLTHQRLVADNRRIRLEAKIAKAKTHQQETTKKGKTRKFEEAQKEVEHLTFELTLKNKELASLDIEISQCERKGKELEEEQKDQEAIKGMRDIWDERQKAELKFLQDLPKPEKTAWENYKKLGYENSRRFNEEARRLQVNLQIASEFSKGIDSILQNLDQIIRAVPILSPVLPKASGILNGLQKTNQVVSFGYNSWQTYESMKTSYSAWQEALKSPSLNLQGLNLFDQVLKSAELTSFGGLSEVFKQLINPALLMTGQGLGLIIMILGYSQSPTQTVLNALNALSAQIDEGFRYVSSELQDIKGILRIILETNQQQITTLRLMQQSYDRQNDLGREAAQHSVNAVKKNTEINASITEEQTIIDALFRITQLQGRISGIRDFRTDTKDLLVGYVGSLLAELEHSIKNVSSYSNRKMPAPLTSGGNFQDYLYFLDIQRKGTSPSLPNLRVWRELANTTHELLQSYHAKHLANTTNKKNYSDSWRAIQPSLDKIISVGHEIYDSIASLRKKDLTWLVALQRQSREEYEALSRIIATARKNEIQPRQNTLEQCDSLYQSMNQNFIGHHRFFWQDLFYTPIKDQLNLFSGPGILKESLEKNGHLATVLSLVPMIIIFSNPVSMLTAIGVGFSSIGTFAATSFLEKTIFKYAYSDLFDLINTKTSYDQNIIYVPQTKKLHFSNIDTRIYPLKIERARKDKTYIDGKPIIITPTKNRLQLASSTYDELIKRDISTYFKLVRECIQNNSNDHCTVVFPDSSIHKDELIPLIFPTSYLEAIRRNDVFLELNHAEGIGFGSVEINYSFVKLEIDTENNYQLILNCNFRTHQNELLPIVRVKVAVFDTKAVNSFKCMVSTENTYHWQLNLNEFLLFAMMGASRNTGFPGYGTVDLNNHGAVAPVEFPFIGLYRILMLVTDKTFKYNTNCFTSEVSLSFEERIIGGDINIIDQFFEKGLGLAIAKDYGIFKTQFSHYLKTRTIEGKNSPLYTEIRAILLNLYEAALIGMQLAFRLDEETVKKLLKDIHIYNPLEIDQFDPLSFLEEIDKLIHLSPKLVEETLNGYLGADSKSLRDLDVILTNLYGWKKVKNWQNPLAKSSVATPSQQGIFARTMLHLQTNDTAPDSTIISTPTQ